MIPTSGNAPSKTSTDREDAGAEDGPARCGDRQTSGIIGPAHVTGSSCALRRLACVSTSRADAGIYRPLFRVLASNENFHVSCLAGGTHLSSEYGSTLKGLYENKGVTVIPVDHFCRGDRPQDVSATCGRGLTEFSKAMTQARPDLVFVLGDRPEMLAATMAALIHRVPIAHLHGGERTAGAYDDACRHAITKLSHLHFPSHPEYAERILAMGEEDWRIHTVGALALDELGHFEPASKKMLSRTLGLDFVQPVYVVAYYCETLSDQAPAEQVEALLDALRHTDAGLLILGGNADIGGAVIDNCLRHFAEQRHRTRFVASLPHHLFWSCLSHSRLMIGNSSSGIIEAAGFHLPVVNIGDRQAGRIRPRNVVDTPCRADDISAAISRAATGAMRKERTSVANPYGDGRAAERIVSTLYQLPSRQVLLRKA